MPAEASVEEPIVFADSEARQQRLERAARSLVS
jgi:hypothetical protein